MAACLIARMKTRVPFRDIGKGEWFAIGRGRNRRFYRRDALMYAIELRTAKQVLFTADRLVYRAEVCG